MAIICIINDVTNFLIQLQVIHLTKLDRIKEISLYKISTKANDKPVVVVVVVVIGRRRVTAGINGMFQQRVLLDLPIYDFIIQCTVHIHTRTELTVSSLS